jgi:hypothetical protein
VSPPPGDIRSVILSLICKFGWWSLIFSCIWISLSSSLSHFAPLGIILILASMAAIVPGMQSWDVPYIRRNKEIKWTLHVMTSSCDWTLLSADLWRALENFSKPDNVFS